MVQETIHLTLAAPEEMVAEDRVAEESFQVRLVRQGLPILAEAAVELETLQVEDSEDLG